MGILDNAKEVVELVRKYNDIELYQKILDLRDEIFTLREDNLALKERVKELENLNELKGKLIREGNVYFLQSQDGTQNGPYCLACWDGDRKLINVIVQYSGGKKVFSCGRCKAK